MPKKDEREHRVYELAADLGLEPRSSEEFRYFKVRLAKEIARRTGLPQVSRQSVIEQYNGDPEAMTSLRIVKHRIGQSQQENAEELSTEGLIEVPSSDKYWRTQAACRDESPDLFVNGHAQNTRIGREIVTEAKRICAGCNVQDECLVEGIRTESQGVWGGLTREERDAYAQRRQLG